MQVWIGAGARDFDGPESDSSGGVRTSNVSVNGNRIRNMVNSRLDLFSGESHPARHEDFAEQQQQHADDRQ